MLLYNARVAAAWICNRCGSIGVGEMCMQCGNHLSPSKPQIAESGSYFWILGYRTPGIFKFMGLYCVPFFLLKDAAPMIPKSAIEADVAALVVASALIRLYLVPVGFVTVAIVRRCYVSILIAVFVALLIHSVVDPAIWRLLVCAASLFVQAAAAVLGVGFVIAPRIKELWRIVARQLRKLRG